jgi:hypothetical protein
MIIKFIISSYKFLKIGSVRQLRLKNPYNCTGFAYSGARGNKSTWLVKLDNPGCDNLGCAT